MVSTIFIALYTFALCGLSIYAVHSIVLSLLFLYQSRRPRPPIPEPPEVWPLVTVQLPVFNERFVIERLIDAACQLDYPVEALSIQVLDDSTDETCALSRQRVAYYRARGLNIELLHRNDRKGYKAGALGEALPSAMGGYIAIFDADFVPPPDFLHRMIPYLTADSSLGMVQARWGHLNDGYSFLTHGQALLLDGHFVIEQMARSRFGLPFNFNGSAGIWRRACILDAGGWQSDTLAEDLDLSYRAQLKGWRFAYLPEMVAPAELPPLIGAFKLQQYRWARGSIRVLIKLAGPIWHSSLNPCQRLSAYLHLSAYLTHVFMMLALLTCLPVVLAHGAGLPSLPWLSLVSFGPPLMFSLSQWAVYPDWERRMLYFPALMSMGVGIALNNTCAALAALSQRPAVFIRTPKFNLEAGECRGNGKTYHLPADWSVWAELMMAGYAFALVLLAAKDYPPMVLTLTLFALGFGYVGILGLWQGRKEVHPSIEKERLNDPNSLR
jgi:cellulose synthase/poly-beta-1,6-N-acetylglucosamine synthase-like glycosyltransferase